MGNRCTVSGKTECQSGCAAHPQSAGPDFILYPQIGYILAFQTTNSVSVENVSGGFCIESQSWFHHISEVTPQTRTLPTLLRTIARHGAICQSGCSHMNGARQSQERLQCLLMETSREKVDEYGDCKLRDKKKKKKKSSNWPTRERDGEEGNQTWPVNIDFDTSL